jgi:hypothetical protein
MNNRPGQDRAWYRARPAWRPGEHAPDGVERLRRPVVMRRQVDQIAVETENAGVARLAQPRGASRDGIEDRLDVRRRAADDAQNLTGGRLLVERLRQLAVTRPKLSEQADVLDGDDGLGGERPQKVDLLLKEGPRLAPRDPDGSDGAVTLEHRHRQQTAIAEGSGALASQLGPPRFAFDVA